MIDKALVDRFMRLRAQVQVNAEKLETLENAQIQCKNELRVASNEIALAIGDDWGVSTQSQGESYILFKKPSNVKVGNIAHCNIAITVLRTSDWTISLAV